MKFTRDICRLLGIGGDGPDEEEMEVGGGASDQTDGGGGDSYISQDTLSGEECLSEEERNRRRAEKRRAKRKRQKQRKKLEKEEKLEDSPGQGQQGGERGGGGGGAAWESDSDEEEEKKNTGRVAPFRSNKEPSHSPPPPPPPALVPRPAAPPPALVTTRNTGNNRHTPPACRAVEEEPEWDVNSAFVAGAASHIKPKGRRGRVGQSSRENKENEARSNQVESSKDPLKRRGVALTEEGIQMFKQGLYSQAVDMFTAAIHCDPTDHRFYGNRSYCYWCLELYSAALSDAQRSIKLAPDWPKGYFRKGSALMGLKRYSDAEKAMEQVLKLDEGCEEATNELFNCRVLQLMDLGFDEFQGVLLLEKFTTVQAALGSCDLKVEHTSQQDLNGGPCPSLWVGNVTVDITEKDIRDLFKTYGEIESIRVLHERFCAFVNFKNANMAATALERLQGVELEGSRLVIRYPDRWLQRSNCGLGTSSAAAGPRRSLPINGDECFFWRTTGCLYGDKCRFRHIPEQRGRDKKPWQP